MMISRVSASSVTARVSRGGSSNSQLQREGGEQLGLVLPQPSGSFRPVPLAYGIAQSVGDIGVNI